MPASEPEKLKELAGTWNATLVPPKRVSANKAGKGKKEEGEVMLSAAFQLCGTTITQP